MPDQVYLFGVAHALLAYGLVNTKSTSQHRYTYLFLIAICCWNALQSPLIQSVPGGSGLLYTIGFVFHSAHFLCIARLTPPQNGPSPYLWALGQICDARWEIGLKPTFRKLPSKWEFILRRLFDIAWLSASLYMVMNYRLYIWPSDLLTVSDGFLTRFASISARELTIRVYLYVKSLYMSYASLRAAHATCSVIAVTCGGDPASWPPLFGSVVDAYTIRNYYSKFWHQLMRKPWTAIAITTTQKIAPNASRRTAGYLIVFLTFAISAAFHSVATDEHSWCYAYTQARYYMSSCAALLLEDLVIRLARPFVAKRQKDTKEDKKADGNSAAKEGAKAVSSQRPPLKWRLLGYTWVFCFDMWATSKLVFLDFQCSWTGPGV